MCYGSVGSAGVVLPAIPSMPQSFHPGPPQVPLSFPASLALNERESKCQWGVECIPLAVSQDQSPRATCDPGTKLMTAGGYIKKFSSKN